MINSGQKRGKIISIGCCFPSKFVNSGTLLQTGRGDDLTVTSPGQGHRRAVSTPTQTDTRHTRSPETRRQLTGAHDGGGDGDGREVLLQLVQTEGEAAHAHAVHLQLVLGRVHHRHRQVVPHVKQLTGGRRRRRRGSDDAGRYEVAASVVADIGWRWTHA